MSRLEPTLGGPARTSWLYKTDLGFLDQYRLPERPPSSLPPEAPVFRAEHPPYRIPTEQWPYPIATEHPPYPIRTEFLTYAS